MKILRSPRLAAAVLLAAAPVLFAGGPPPTVSSAVNAASYADPSEPGGALARGGIFSVFGDRFLFDGLALAQNFPLPTEAVGVSIDATVAGVTRAAFPLFVSYDQINALLPSDLPAGEGTLTVRTPFGESEPLAIEVVDHAFGLFTLFSSGAGPAVATDPLEADPNAAVNTAIHSAHAGEMWDLWGTGLGPIETSDGEAPPMVDRTDVDVRVLVGGMDAEVLYRGRSPCCAGLDQIRFVVPEGLEGCCTEVVVVVEGVESNRATMALGPVGDDVCDRERYSPETLAMLAAGVQRRGAVSFSRSVRWSAPDQGELAESIFASFTALPVGGLFDPCAEPEDSLYLTAPCQVSQGLRRTIFFDLEGEELGRVERSFPAVAMRVGDFSNSVIPQSRFDPAPAAAAVSPERLAEIGRAQIEGIGGRWFEPRFLDAGEALTVTGPDGEMELPAHTRGMYPLVVTSGAPAGSDDAGALTAGAYAIHGPGGEDVPEFDVSLDVPEPFEWTNRAETHPLVDRAQPLRLAWSGGTPEFETVSVSGASWRAAAPGDSAFSCRVPYEPGSYTVPVSILRAVYASDEAGGGARISLSAGSSRMAEVAGLDGMSLNWNDYTEQLTAIGGEGEEPAPLEVVKRVEPEYPAAAREAGIEGVVVAYLSLDADGDRVRNVHISGGPEALREAVRLALLGWEFSGDPGPTVRVEATFELPDRVTTRVVE